MKDQAALWNASLSIKDKKTPIFRVADYRVVDDLFKVVEALKVKLTG
jgi:electron transfer flavoprotein alpha subunit